MHNQIRSGLRRRTRWWAALTGALLAVSTLTACGESEQGTVINLYGSASAKGFDAIIADCNTKAGGKYKIVGNLLPSDADGQREQLVRRLAAKNAGMDLLGLDVTWTAEFAEAGWVRELDDAQKAQANAGVLQPPIETATWKGKQYGIPKHTNVQILWYRKSLVPNPPKTYDEMLAMANKLKSEGKPYLVSFTAAQYEGYVVNVNNVVNAYDGKLVNEDSTKAVVDDGARKGFELLKKLADSGVTSASLSNAQEPEVFADLQQGRAAFAINWPYVLSAMRSAGNTDIADDLGFTTFPTVSAGQDPKVTLGGMNYAVSSYSKHPQEAFEAAMCLRSRDHQLQTALEAGDPPVMEDLYSDPAFIEKYPMTKVMLEELKTATPRPRTPVYQDVSTIISKNMSPPASIDPAGDQEKLRKLIQNAIDGKGILP